MQWNPSNQGTLGTRKNVLISEVNMYTILTEFGDSNIFLDVLSGYPVFRLTHSSFNAH